MKKTVSIGIPAYNEEGNIGHLINALLKQKGDNFTLKEIIIISDASNDKTAETVKSISDERIIFSENKERIGQALSQNLILEQFTGDILIFLNADVLPVDEYFIQEMTQPFYKDPRIGIVSSREIPLDPQIFLKGSSTMVSCLRRVFSNRKTMLKTCTFAVVQIGHFQVNL